LDWWGPVWRGLVVDPSGKHFKAIRNALWVYVYLVIHAERATGMLRRKVSTIARDTGINARVIQYGLERLRRGGYITTKNTGRYLEFKIEKWKPLRGNTRQNKK
jgi:hypothetical protein